jgi:hypothetical protein
VLRQDLLLTAVTAVTDNALLQEGGCILGGDVGVLLFKVQGGHTGEVGGWLVVWVGLVLVVAD